MSVEDKVDKPAYMTEKQRNYLDTIYDYHDIHTEEEKIQYLQNRLSVHSFFGGKGQELRALENIFLLEKL